MKTIKVKETILYILILFPITTIIQGIPILGNINRVMMFILLGLMFVSLYTKNIKTKNVIVALVTAMLYFFAIINTNRNLELNYNIYFYFLFWIVFFLYVKDQYDYIIEFTKNNYTFIFKMIKIWSIIVVISFCFKKSYNTDGYFSPFGCGEHRFGSCCVMITALLSIVRNKINKKYINLFFILPILGIVMCGARTYLAIYVVLFLCILYINFKNKTVFYLSLVPIMIIMLVLIKNSPVGNKFVNTYTDGYNGMLATFTSGRSHFWQYDIEAFNSLSFIKKLVGDGFDFVYYVNLTTVNLLIWAHNDFINVVMNFGYLGLILYLYVFMSFSLKIIKNKNITVICKYSYFFIWFFNAMFNMVYTYIIATIAIPFILNMMCDENLLTLKLEKGEKKDGK